ncbi:hypothetical protein ABHN05_11375 [Brevibacillus laterosporus]|uniref:hypothetical protein n=1 Tax=Brevibacillus TaxID=55080 RepID=UPI00112772AC|nr:MULTISPECIES: hypothetical protein [Brevibacillus]MBG9790538.1 hypothetical protein [Brevibacillus laterosporus]MBG9804934.1 hypothetical protein [Brevibacillus laterosporus]MCR8964133.1 hypothetical protein [Brevibacillus laterosporus]MCZ0836288.1 hypothetical protein [Brevibacillus halotolerans]MED1786626.1 hypothetical protein [Brevibacillus laterosporus]
MEVADIVSMIANVGFPVTLCFILIRYVLDTIGERLDSLDASLKQLADAIQSVQRKNEQE